MALFQPLINMAGYEHCLNAMPCFVHPGNNTIYGISIEKRGGVTQNLSVYRKRSGSSVVEHVHTYIGGQDSAAQIAAGGCVIDQTGALEVWASAVPMGIPPITKTGFVGGFWPKIAHVDEPWSMSAGGVTLLDAVATNPAWEARSLTAGVMVDIPSTFGVPSASAYLARVTVNAPVANVRARFGTEACPYFFTVNSQAGGVDAMQQGWVPGPACYVSPAQGSPVVWFQVVGYSA